MLACYISLHPERDNRAKWKTLTCRWERALTCQRAATLQTARTLKLMKSSGIRAGIRATSLLVHTNLPQLRKICICSFKPGMHIFLGDFWHLWVFTQTVGFLLRLFPLPSSLPPVKQFLCEFLSFPDTWCCFAPCVPEICIIFLSEQHVFTHVLCSSLTVNPLKRSDPSLSSLSLTCLDRHWAALSLTRQSGTLIQTHTTVCLSRGHALTLSHWEAGIINSLGLSGVSAWLFSPDIIIARVETVTTRGHTGRER